MIEEAEANPQEFFSLEVHNKAIRRLQAEEAAGRLVVHADGSFEDRGIALAFSKVLSTADFCSEYTRALTFENGCQVLLCRRCPGSGRLRWRSMLRSILSVEGCKDCTMFVVHT